MIYYRIKIILYAIAELLFGRKRLRHLYLRYSVKKYKKAGLIFIHIPRTGGTSISNAIFGKRNGHFSALELRSFLGKDIFNSIYSFALVRNPYERLLSAYLFIKNSGSKHGAVRPNKVFTSKAFENFENFVKMWLVFQPQHSIDLLLRPQFLFVTDEKENLIISNIYKIENLEKFKYQLESVVGRSFTIPKLNITNHIHFSSYYNQDIVDLVFNYYKKDFIIFQYTKELPT